ncbi:MAG: CheR family methyltransferase [Microcoleus sp.]
MKAVKLNNPEKYYQLLTAQNGASENEWRQLVLLLTTNESYFMRDKGQFLLLEKVILPELIEQKIKLQKTLGTQPTLRIWSAGCSTGEEPYSLAILLQQLIANWSQWNILVLGTDLNEVAIEKAQRGVYSSWSFRLVDPQVQNRYFKRHRDEWEIDKKLRNLVEFKLVNLVTDNFPSIYHDIYNMDLILCRNVFVYFESKYTSIALKKFAKTLRPGGYLMTGHAEVYGQSMSEFQTKVFPESVVYQRRDSQQNECCHIDSSTVSVPRANLGRGQTIKPTAVRQDRDPKEMTQPDNLRGFSSAEMTPILIESTRLGKMLRARYVENEMTAQFAPKTEESKTVAKLIIAAKTCFKNKSYIEAIEKAKQAISLQENNFDAYYLLAQIYANLGQYSRAIDNCQRASEVDSLSVFPYYLQAHIAEETGDLATAKKYFKRIIYLYPSFISAYLELGNIYHQEGQTTRAIKMYNSACEILKKLPPTTAIEQHGKTTASQMLIDVKKILLKLYSQ